MASTTPRGREAVRIVSREQWGAMDARLDFNGDPIKKINLPMDHVCFTHTGEDPCETTEECAAVVRKHQKEHMDISRLPDISYSFLIGGDGIVYEGRGWSNEPHRPLLYEDYYEGRGIEIGYIGNYKDNAPSPKMLRTAFNFILYGLKQGLIKQTFQALHL